MALISSGVSAPTSPSTDTFRRGRVSMRNFAVSYAPRRPGDIMTMVADTSRIRATLDWTPQFDDLETIAAHALAWEAKLFRDRGGLPQHAESA